MLSLWSPDVKLVVAGCYACGRRMLRLWSPDVKLQEPEMLPEAPGRSYGKNKSIGNISESNLIDDRSFIF